MLNKMECDCIALQTAVGSHQPTRMSSMQDSHCKPHVKQMPSQQQGHAKPSSTLNVRQCLLTTVQLHHNGVHCRHSATETGCSSWQQYQLMVTEAAYRESQHAYLFCRLLT